jgi:hypothetical protein
MKEARLNRHIEGLRGMISRRGGWSVFRNCTVTFHLNWCVLRHMLQILMVLIILFRFDILCSGEISLGMTPLSYFPTGPKKGESCLRLYVQEFCAFFWSLIGQQISYMHPLVEPESLIGQMLSTNKEEVMVLQHSAVLIYLSATGIDLRHFPDRTNTLNRLNGKVAAQAIGPEASLGGVLWALCVDFDTLRFECPERVFLLSRILYVFKHLQSELIHTIDKQMLLFMISDRRDEIILRAQTLESEIWSNIQLAQAEGQ